MHAQMPYDAALAERRSLFLVGVAILVKALLLFVALPAASEMFAGRYGIGFADDYDVLAGNLAAGSGYRFDARFGETMMREPGYPMFLAGVFALLGPGIEAARIANLILAGAGALLVGTLCRRVSSDAFVPPVAMLVFLFHPGVLVAEARGGVELLFIFGLLCLMWMLYRALDSGRRWHFFLAGIALGLVVMVRSTPLLFPGLLLLYLLWRPRAQEPRWEPLVSIACIGVGALIVMMPWAVRNYALVERVVPTASVQGVAAQEGQYTCEHASTGRGFEELQHEAASRRNATAEALGLRFERGYYQYFYSPRDELRFNAELQRRTLDRYVDQPGLFVRCALRNLGNFWILGKNATATAMNAAVQLPFLAVALAGVALLWRGGLVSAAAPILLFVVYVIAVHAPIIAHTRHSVPLVPFLAPFAGVALVHLWRSVRLGAQRRIDASPA